MGKRKRRQSAELPLFDLPLRPAAGEPPSGDEARSRDEPGAASRSAPETPSGPSVLDEEGGAGGHEVQLDLVDLGEPEAAELEAGEPDARALLGDRLLGGLADLAVQLVTSGLALAAVNAMDVAVSWSDWMPFGVLALVFSFLYWVIPLAFWGQTPGMAWVGHVARAADGEPLTFSQTFRRWLGALLTLALAGLPLLLTWTGRSFSDRLSDSDTVAEA